MLSGRVPRSLEPTLPSHHSHQPPLPRILEGQSSLVRLFYARTAVFLLRLAHISGKDEQIEGGTMGAKASSGLYPLDLEFVADLGADGGTDTERALVLAGDILLYPVTRSRYRNQADALEVEPVLTPVALHHWSDSIVDPAADAVHPALGRWRSVRASRLRAGALLLSGPRPPPASLRLRLELDKFGGLVGAENYPKLFPRVSTFILVVVAGKARVGGDLGLSVPALRQALLRL